MRNKLTLPVANVRVRGRQGGTRKLGKLPFQLTVGGRYYAEGPTGGPELDLRLVVMPLFPTSQKPTVTDTNKGLAK
jgi:hypothetical protein